LGGAVVVVVDGEVVDEVVDDDVDEDVVESGACVVEGASSTWRGAGAAWPPTRTSCPHPARARRRMIVA
jgi:hypothetical protein